MKFTQAIGKELFPRGYRLFETALLGLVVGFFLSIALSSNLHASDNRVNWVVLANEKNREAVVNIEGDKVNESADLSKDSGKSYNGMGTGIILDERGYIVTNYHVVEGIRKIQVTTFDQTTYIATLVARDTETDLAIIKITPKQSLKTITLGHSDDLMPGECCMAIGNPYGYPFSVTDGRVSGIARKVEVNDMLLYKDAIQTSTPINPGNSGGPLINVDGEMIGINAAIRQGAECIAFAIPVDQVIEVAAKLIGDLVGRSSYHGLRVYQTEKSRNTSDKKGSEKASDNREYQVVVESVDTNGPAETAGIREGDIVVGINGYRISNILDFNRAMLDVRAKDDVNINIIRNSEKSNIAMLAGSPRENLNVRGQASQKNRIGSTLAGMNPVSGPEKAPVAPKVASLSQNQTRNLDQNVWTTLGIRCESIPKESFQKEYAQYLNEYPHGGIVVKEVREGSPFAEKGVMPGDVIVTIHEWVTISQNDLRYIAKVWSTTNAPGNKVRMNLFRDGLPYFTEIPLSAK